MSYILVLLSEMMIHPFFTLVIVQKSEDGILIEGKGSLTDFYTSKTAGLQCRRDKTLLEKLNERWEKGCAELARGDVGVFVEDTYFHDRI